MLSLLCGKREYIRLPTLVRRLCRSTFISNGDAYVPRNVERKWQERWFKPTSTNERSYGVPAPDGAKTDHYVLSMFPYPSGDLHIGHARVYTISDCITRQRRMDGFNVFSPMGFDAFGLPAENASRERGVAPDSWTASNCASMEHQLRLIGADLDFGPVVSSDGDDRASYEDHPMRTCSPSYYTHTQRLFLMLYKHGLVEQRLAAVNWDPVDETVLANEQVDASGRSWRSGARVERRVMRQWFVKTTAYAARLFEDLDALSQWPERVKAVQRQWIGNASGVLAHFELENALDKLSIFTTRLDTLYGVTYVALSRDHPLLLGWAAAVESSASAETAVKRLPIPEEYQARVVDYLTAPTATVDEKSTRGVFTGLFAKHPASGERVPVFAADYVLSGYGTGAVMGVPAHDSRDALFARDHGLRSVQVVTPVDATVAAACGDGVAYTEHGVLINSDRFDGLTSAEAIDRMVEHFGPSVAEHHETHRLRDWLVSRQRYWGCPIPIVHCDTCGAVPVPDEQLPVRLPPSSTLGSALRLADNEEYARTTCPQCQRDGARRELDTLDTFVCSSFYMVRFLDVDNREELVARAVAERFLPVDVYIGGIEHAAMHLLYARFVAKFLADIDVIPKKAHEPFKRLLTQGMVLARTFRAGEGQPALPPADVEWRDGSAFSKRDGSELSVRWEKMSKSKYNGVDPTQIVDEYGADTLRCYVLFKAPPESELEWDVDGVRGIQRWLHRLWTVVGESIDRDVQAWRGGDADEAALIEEAVLECVARVSAAFDDFHFNVCLARLMELSNTLAASSTREHIAHLYAVRTLLILVAPFAPHLSAELWARLCARQQSVRVDASDALRQCGGSLAVDDVHSQRWPRVEAAKRVKRVSSLSVMFLVGSKRRGSIVVQLDELESPKTVHSVLNDATLTVVGQDEAPSIDANRLASVCIEQCESAWKHIEALRSPLRFEVRFLARQKCIVRVDGAR